MGSIWIRTPPPKIFWVTKRDNKFTHFQYFKVDFQYSTFFKPFSSWDLFACWHFELFVFECNSHRHPQPFFLLTKMSSSTVALPSVEFFTLFSSSTDGREFDVVWLEQIVALSPLLLCNWSRLKRCLSTWKIRGRPSSSLPSKFGVFAPERPLQWLSNGGGISLAFWQSNFIRFEYSPVPIIAKHPEKNVS